MVVKPKNRSKQDSQIMTCKFKHDNMATKVTDQLQLVFCAQVLVASFLTLRSIWGLCDSTLPSMLGEVVWYDLFLSLLSRLSG
eukprot:2879274-Amphidinium_carterae.1